jgi:hypothetical protein
MEKIQMVKYGLVVASIAAACVLGQPNAAVHAQVSPSQRDQAISPLGDVRTSILRAIGAQEQAIEITVSDKVLTVSRVNSNMNESTHAGRDNEATAIVAVVSKAIAGKQEFKNLITIVVQYVVRATLGESKVIDTVEFREDPNGVFVFHRT